MSAISKRNSKRTIQSQRRKKAPGSGRTASNYSSLSIVYDDNVNEFVEDRQIGAIQRSVLNSGFSTVNSWTMETDIEDTVQPIIEMQTNDHMLSLELDTKYIDINYNVINTVLFYINECRKYIGKANDVSIEIKDKQGPIYLKLKSILDILPTDEKKLYLLNFTFKNILILYTQIKKFPMADAYINQKYEKIVLYRGWGDISLKFRGINEREKIITPVFLSTTILEHVALKFCSHHNIIWKIKIPKRKLNIFNYVFLSKSVKKIRNITVDMGEAEFLLNIGAILECKKKNIDKEKSYPDSIFDQTNKKFVDKIVKKTCTEYVFEFIGWDILYIDMLKDYNVEKLLEPFKN